MIVRVFQVVHGFVRSVDGSRKLKHSGSSGVDLVGYSETGGCIGW